MDSATAIMSPSVTRMLVGSPEPHASVYLNLQSAEPSLNTDQDRELRWRALADRLRAQGADEPNIEAIARHLRAQPVYPSEYAIFAAGGAVRFAQPLPDGPSRVDLSVDQARFGPPTYVVPLLAWQQHHPAYVVIVADRTGADLTAVPRGALHGASSVVTGPDDVIERNAPGGWSQASYQRRAIDSWQHNAVAVVEAATHELHRVNARLLLVAGDVRAVQLLAEHLPVGVRRGVALRHLAGGRSPDGSGSGRAEAISAALTEYADGLSAQLLAQFAEENRPGGTAVAGVHATLAALAQGQVATLLVADEPDDGRLAWFGLGSSDDGAQTLCAEVGTVRPTDASPWLIAGRLVDVAVRAALLTGAEVHVLSPEHAHGIDGRIGALCRFAPGPAAANGAYPGPGAATGR